MRNIFLAAVVTAATALTTSYANATILRDVPASLAFVVGDAASQTPQAGGVQQRATHERDDIQARQPELGDEGAARPAL